MSQLGAGSRPISDNGIVDTALSETIKLETGKRPVSAGLNIWLPCGKRDDRDEIQLKCVPMMEQDWYAARTNIEVVLQFGDQFASGRYDNVMTCDGRKCFRVLEVELPKKVNGTTWYVYFVKAEGKSCLLLLDDHSNRTDAIHRAKRWINHCPHKEIHGMPEIVTIHDHSSFSGD